MYSAFFIYSGNVYCRAGSMAVQLPQYVMGIPITMTIAPFGHPHPQCIALTPQAQQLMRRVLVLMPDTRTNARCFLGLNANNIMVDTVTGIPYLRVVWTNYDADLARMNYTRLEEIFRETIFNEVLLATLPPDIHGLLHLMRTDGDAHSYAIQHHCSLVLAGDKITLFLRLYNYLHDILRWQDYLLYEGVVNNLYFYENWQTIIPWIPYLASFYIGGEYGPLFLGDPLAGGVQVLRFMRNTYSHPLQHAWNIATGQRMYGEAQLVDMMETLFPLLIHSHQLALHIRGRLTDIPLCSLFL
ncbi:unnamed protein product [Alopecurus aequalis]